MATVGQTLVQNLVDRGVEIIFGIPGVHTIELYRGIENADIRHITPRHEQGAGFMADGYARMSGKPGVVFVITGPGLVNTMTPMAQARADSVPMIVVTGVNRRDSLGKGLGLLHELPDQFGLSQTVSKHAEHIASGADLEGALTRSFAALEGRPGPVHIEVPTDVMDLPVLKPLSITTKRQQPQPDLELFVQALADSAHPVILVGGGCRRQDKALTQLAEKLDAPGGSDSKCTRFDAWASFDSPRQPVVAICAQLDCTKPTAFWHWAPSWVRRTMICMQPGLIPR